MTGPKTSDSMAESARIIPLGNTAGWEPLARRLNPRLAFRAINGALAWTYLEFIHHATAL